MGEKTLNDGYEGDVELDDISEEDLAALLGDEQDLESLKSENAELKDRLLRSLADAENTRKRGERDRRDAEVYGGTRLARDLLSVYDNLSRALEAITDSLRETAKPLIEGLELTQRELLQTFSKHKITKLHPETGTAFDPKLHQAMFEAALPGTIKGTIIQVMSPGFMIGERLLRPAHVGVSSNPIKIEPGVEIDEQ